MRLKLIPFIFFCSSCFAQEPVKVNITDVLKNKRMSSVDCMIYNLYHEVRSGTKEEMVAVLNTVMNRVNSKHYPEDICGVIKQPSQYSWTDDGLSDVMKDSVSVERIRKLVDWYLIHKKTILEDSDDVDHYHLASISPYWSKSDRMKKIGLVGSHIFYRRR